MKNKIIVDLCGGTGSWSKPYKDAGYTVHNITLPWYDVTKCKFENEVLKFEPMEWVGNWEEATLKIPIKYIYGILAAPPCTMFSLARTNAKEPRDLRKGMEVVKACLEIIWECRFNSKLEFWALENPGHGLLRQFLGKEPFRFQPNEFGDPYTKLTSVWGYFNEPKKKPVPIPKDVITSLAINNRILPQLPAGYKEPGRRNQAARRAMTSPGFAQAFFKANL